MDGNFTNGNKLDKANYGIKYLNFKKEFLFWNMTWFSNLLEQESYYYN